jgi:hypothetical protein
MEVVTHLHHSMVSMPLIILHPMLPATLDLMSVSTKLLILVVSDISLTMVGLSQRSISMVQCSKLPMMALLTLRLAKSIKQFMQDGIPFKSQQLQIIDTSDLSIQAQADVKLLNSKYMEQYTII